jgi:hypothetical protein
MINEGNDMRKKKNAAIRQFMVNQVGIQGPMASQVLVTDAKQAFPSASSKQIAGNLSAVCCYFGNLHYNDGIVS